MKLKEQSSTLPSYLDSDLEPNSDEAQEVVPLIGKGGSSRRTTTP